MVTKPQNKAQEQDIEMQEDDKAQATEAQESQVNEGITQEDQAIDKDKEIADMRDQMLRALADAENTRRRAKQQVEDASKYAVAGFARDLINVLENLHRAADSIPEEAVKENELIRTVSEGVNMTKRELLNAFEKHGIKRIDPLGEKFNHDYHQAIAQVEDETKEPGTITQVVQAGYVLNDRLLRPAMVVVVRE